MSDPPWWQKLQAQNRKERLARERRLKAKKAKEQAEFEERTSRQFAEFKELLGVLQARAKEAATARAACQKEAKPWVWRRLEDLQAQSLRSRQVTLIYRRRKD